MFQFHEWILIYVSDILPLLLVTHDLIQSINYGFNDQILLAMFLIQLFPDCAPHSVAYILELLRSRHCAGCQIYRAEGRGYSWDTKGNHISDVKDANFLHKIIIYFLSDILLFRNIGVNSVIEEILFLQRTDMLIHNLV